jgi:hypothetical protein
MKELNSPAPTKIRTLSFIEAVKASIEWSAILLNDQQFCAALRLLRSHQLNSADKTLLDDQWVTFAVCLAVLRRGGRSPRRHFEKVLPFGTRKSWKALKAFPKILRKIAADVEQVNRNQYLAPATWMFKETDSAAITKDSFKALPQTLLAYAACIETILKRRLPALISATDLWARRNRKHSPALFQLCQRVEKATGRPHDQEICNLLDAAAVALGVKGYQWDPQLLAQARLRAAKKSKDS